MDINIRPNRIKEWIAKRSLNQSQVAKQLGISTSYLSLITNGKRNPNLRLSTKLANILDAELLDLFPQVDETVVTGETVDVVFSFSPHSDLEPLAESLRQLGAKIIVSEGDFETGYFVANYRPYILLLDVESFGTSLTFLVQRLRSEPITSHTQVIPLVRPDVGKRRRRQIDKIGLKVFHWDSGDLTTIANNVKEILQQVKQQAAAN